MTSLKLLQLGSARSLVAVGFLIMIGSGMAVPIVYYLVEPNMVLLTFSAGAAMIGGYALVRLGDGLSPRSLELVRSRPRRVALRYDAMPLKLVRRSHRHGSRGPYPRSIQPE